MKNKLIYTLFISLLFMQDEIGSGLYSSDLINYLNNNYKTNSVLSYGSARDVLYGEIEAPSNNGQVYGVYTRYSVALPLGVDPSSYLYDNGMDCEHVWPQSMYEGSSPMKSDMHHLRPCKSNVNSSRGNKPFNEIDDNLTNTWYWLNTQLNNIPSSNIDEYSESGSSYFEPREDMKGDIARSMFYFYTIYSSVAEDDFFNLQKEILYQWHNNDPVNNNEINRTWAIAGYQNNIPNPFIIDSTLIYRCYFYDESELGCDGIPNSGLEFDECGVCGGFGIEEGACDCSGNIDFGCGCGETAPSGCDNLCGSSSEVDICGICSGNAESCFIQLSIGSITNDNIEILINSTLPIISFQFDIGGLNILSASGGIANDYNYIMSSINSMVIGFSMNNIEIPPIQGVLTNLSYNPIMNEICLFDEIFALGNWAGGFYDIDIGTCVFLDCGEDNESDCMGYCGGEAIIDVCGVCGGNNLTCADINNDNTINVTDVIFLVNLVLSGSTNSSGDINNDGSVNISDIVMLVHIIIGENS